MGWKLLLLILATVFMFGCSGDSDDDSRGSITPPTDPDPDPDPQMATVLAYEPSGMHLMDKEYSVFALSPPSSDLKAQVVLRDDQGNPSLATDADVDVTYDAVADADGSINSTSYSTGSDKTDFWVHADNLFGIGLESGEGLYGFFMPDDNTAGPGEQAMEFDSGMNMFTADGIPITPIDDAQSVNPYPLMRVSAKEKDSEDAIGTLDTVVAVSTDSHCSVCHSNIGIASDDESITWSVMDDTEIQSKENILILHDAREGTSLFAAQPVLCSECHYSRPLDTAGAGPTGDQAGNPDLSKAMHDYHADLMEGDAPVFPPDGTVNQNCLLCHPGEQNRFHRGVHQNGGMDCLDCHGTVAAVGGDRAPYVDMPLCQSCHTGDAVSRLTGADLVPAQSGIRLWQAYRIGDETATPIVATNKRFAEEDGKLYSESKGHGGVACGSCHGSAHATWFIWETDEFANDKVAATQLQDHPGPILECTACHGEGSLQATIGGPHGIHNIGDQNFVDNHAEFFNTDPDNCRACHGTDLTGTRYAMIQADRSFTVDGAQKSYSRGEFVGCGKCHSIPTVAPTAAAQP